MPRSKVFKHRESQLQSVIELIQKEAVRFIDLQFADVPGRLQHTTIPAEHLNIDAFREGLPKLDGSSIKGFVKIEESDLVLKPDPDTFAIIPWISEDIKTARMFCDIYVGYEGERLSRDPRWISQKAEQLLKDAGYDYSFWGPEPEFFVFDKVTWDVLNSYGGQSYKIESKEAAWNSSGYPIKFREGYFPAPPQDTLMDYRSECVRVLMESFRIGCDCHHHEVATGGQCEINISRGVLTRTADNVMTLKYVVKNIAYLKNMVATFMPKPVYLDNASGMHIHVSIWKDGKNLFYDPDDPYAELSQLARYFIGGLLEHSCSLCAVAAPTTNSYRRLVPGYEAPIYCAWSRKNRSANVRIPAYHKGPKAAKQRRIEFRPPDPSCNPYLCFSAMLAAGLDGVKRKIDPGDPVDENIYKLTSERRKQLGIKQLPGDLEKAAESLKSDRDYLKPIFTEDLIEKIVEMEIAECKEITLRPHPYEFYLYFER